jgi:hypothetical protein
MLLKVSSRYNEDDWQEIDFAKIKAERDTRTETNLEILITKIQEMQAAGSGEVYDALKAELIEILQLNNIDLSKCRED